MEGRPCADSLTISACETPHHHSPGLFKRLGIVCYMYVLDVGKRREGCNIFTGKIKGVCFFFAGATPPAQWAGKKKAKYTNFHRQIQI